MEQTTLEIKCSRCLGTGVDDNLIPPGPCEACGGDGLVGSGYLDITTITDLLEKIQKDVKKILKKLDIKE